MKKQSNRYYIAYGSNLHIDQMKWRCPGATILGTARINDYALLFRGSKTGSYLTIEPEKGKYVPVVIWEVTPEDEKALDRYEGFPHFYYKKDFTLFCKGIRTGQRRKITAFAYIMHEDRPAGIPSDYYMRVCEDGYDTFYFPKKLLADAVGRSMDLIVGAVR